MRDREAHLVLNYLIRVGVEWRVKDGRLLLRPTDPLTDHDRQWIRRIEPRLTAVIESGERVVDDSSWWPRLDTPEHRARSSAYVVPPPGTDGNDPSAI